MSKTRFSKPPVDPADAQGHGISFLPVNHPDRASHAERWLAHVQAGRIGEGPSTTPAQRIRHARNELVLVGRIY